LAVEEERLRSRTPRPLPADPLRLVSVNVTDEPASAMAASELGAINVPPLLEKTPVVWMPEAWVPADVAGLLPSAAVVTVTLTAPEVLEA